MKAEYIVTIEDGRVTKAQELVRCRDCVYWVENYTPTCDFCTLDGVGRGADYFCDGGLMKGAENHE